MPERLIRPRRPIGWNSLLRKGHVHKKSPASGRREAKTEVQGAIDEYHDMQMKPKPEGS